MNKTKLELAASVSVSGFTEWFKAKGGILIDEALTAVSILNPSFGLTVLDDVKYALETTLQLKSTMKINSGNPSENFASAIGGSTEGLALRSSLGAVGIKVTNTQLSFIYAYDEYALDKYIMSAVKAKGTRSSDDVYLSAFLAIIAEDLVDVTNQGLFLGDTDSTDANLAKFDGFVKQILAATGDAAAIRTGTAPVALTSLTAVTKVNAMIDAHSLAFPKLIKKKKRLFVSNYDFEVIKKAYLKQAQAIDKNTIVDDGSITEFVIPATKTVLTATDGLDGTYNRILCRPALLIPVTDSVEEDSKVYVSHDENAEYYYIKGKYKMGAKVALTEEIVIDAAPAE